MWQCEKIRGRAAIIWSALLAVSIFNLPAFSATTEPAPAGQNKLLASIVDAHKQREVALTNIDFLVEQESVNLNTADGTVQRHNFTRLYEIRRDGERWWIHFQEALGQAKANGERFDSWDGKLTRIIVWAAGAPHPTALFDVNRSPYYANNSYNIILDSAPLPGDGSGVELGTFSQWLRESNPADITLSSAAGGQTLLVLMRYPIPKLPNVHRTRTAEFDPSKGMMPVRFEYKYEAGSALNNWITEVKDSRKAGDIWIPTTVVQHNRTNALPGIESRDTYTIKAFSVGTVKPSDMAIVFPPGTRVNDPTQKIAYDINPDGSVHMIGYPPSRPTEPPGDPSQVDKDSLGRSNLIWWLHPDERPWWEHPGTMLP